MVSYLILVSSLILIISGITFSFTSDMVDAFLTAINSYQGTPLANQMDQSSIDTGNFLLVLFRIVVLFVGFISLIFFNWVMSQKPVRQW